MSMAEKMFRVGYGGMSPRKGTPKSWELDMPEPDRELALGNETYLYALMASFVVLLAIYSVYTSGESNE